MCCIPQYLQFLSYNCVLNLAGCLGLVTVMALLVSYTSLPQKMRTSSPRCKTASGGEGLQSWRNDSSMWLDDCDLTTFLMVHWPVDVDIVQFTLQCNVRIVVSVQSHGIQSYRVLQTCVHCSFLCPHCSDCDGVTAGCS